MKFSQNMSQSDSFEIFGFKFDAGQFEKETDGEEINQLKESILKLI